MNILRWPIEESLKKEINEHYRTKYALALRDKEPMEIVKAITFDNVAPEITLQDVETFVNYVDTKLLGKKIRGVGLEVGAGCGFFSSIFAKNSAVDKVYAVEVCENIVTELMSRISEFVCGATASQKVIGCIGDFDHLKLPDSSVDFIFDFYSLHHSPDLNTTLRELYRILKPAGVIFCFDKARENTLNYEDLERLLDTPYSAKAKQNMGVAESVALTRRMNGEKEYRLNDWKNAFTRAGFHTFTHYHIARTVSGRPVVEKIKKVISYLPIWLQTVVTRIFARGSNKNSLEQSHTIYTSLVEHFPKEISFMSASK